MNSRFSKVKLVLVTAVFSMSALAVSQSSQAASPLDILKAPQYAYDKSNVDSLCRDKWEKRGKVDRRMFRFCKKMQKRGHRSLFRLIKKRKKLAWISDLMPVIWNKWTKRGITDYSMVHFGLNREVEGFLDYEYETKQSDYDAGRMSRCAAKWQSRANPWSMTMYCYKKM